MSNWVIPQAAWLSRVTGGVVLSAVELSGVIGEQTATPTDKANDILAQIVNTIRGAIGTGNRVPLSATVQTVGDVVMGSLPTELIRHALILTVEGLVSSIPNMGFVIDANFRKKITTAEKVIEELSGGSMTCTWPTDPVTIDAGGNPVGPQLGGRLRPEPWLGTEGFYPDIVRPVVQAGQTVYSGTVNPNGFQTAKSGDFYNQYEVTGQLIQIWQFAGVTGNNTGWLPYVF